MSRYNFVIGVLKSKSNMAESKYVIKIVARDIGDPVLTSPNPAIVRIDIFDPESHVVKFLLNMTLLDYKNKESSLMRQIGGILSNEYPLSYVRRWCVMEQFP